MGRQRRRLKRRLWGYTDVNYRSISDIPESELVELLLADADWRPRIIGLSAIPANVRYCLSVNLATAPGACRGDVDILLAAPNHPELATAIQVKRVKYGAKAVRAGQPNKLGDLELGVRQTNLLATIGFSQVYFYVLVVVDTRQQNLTKTTSYDGISHDLKMRLENNISRATRGLDARVGLYQADCVQPMDNAPLGVGTFVGILMRLAQPTTQSIELTRWVAKVIIANRP
jgi:hypothetical protein